MRGIRLAEGDEVISLSVLRHVEATNEERAAYLEARRNAKRRGNGDEESRADGHRCARRPPPICTLDAERIQELEQAEEFLLTVTECRLRQAHLGLRVPGDRAGRAGHRQHHAGAAQRHARWSRPSRCGTATT